MSYKLFTTHLIIALSATLIFGCVPSQQISFNGSNAKYYVEKQIEFGPRIPGSDSSNAVKEFIKKPSS